MRPLNNNMNDTRIGHVPDGYEEILRDSKAIQFGMLRNLIASMRRLAKSPQRVAAYFEHPAVTYAKAA